MFEGVIFKIKGVDPTFKRRAEWPDFGKTESFEHQGL